MTKKEYIPNTTYKYEDISNKLEENRKEMKAILVKCYKDCNKKNLNECHGVQSQLIYVASRDMLRLYFECEALQKIMKGL